MASLRELTGRLWRHRGLSVAVGLALILGIVLGCEALGPLAGGGAHGAPAQFGPPQQFGEKPAYPVTVPAGKQVALNWSRSFPQLTPEQQKTVKERADAARHQKEPAHLKQASFTNRPTGPAVSPSARRTWRSTPGTSRARGRRTAPAPMAW